MADSVEQRVFRIVSAVFGVTLSSVSRTMSADNVRNWDSVNIINLLLALESEFDIMIDVDEAEQLLSVELVLAILAERDIT